MRVSWILLSCPLWVGVAHAELPDPTCVEEWWEFAYQTPLDVTGLPAETRVLLPVRWSAHFVTGVITPTEEGLAPGVLVVDVRDADDQPVAGSVGVGLPENDGRWDFPLARQVWWRPTAPLAPGAYTAHVAVTEPTGPSFATCYFPAIDSEVTFHVAATVPPNPTLDLQASLELSIDRLVYTDECADYTDTRPCDAEAGWCCFSADRYLIAASATASGLVVGGPSYYVLQVRQDRINPPYDEINKTYQALADGVAVSLDQAFIPAPYELRSWPKERCIAADLRSLADDRVVATGMRCVDMQPGPEAFPDFACDPIACAEAAGHGPVADDPTASDPDPAGAEVAAPSDARPDGGAEPAASGEGCASGGARGPDLAPILGLVMVCLARGARRHAR